MMTDDGHALGTLCMLDRTVRQLSKEQADALLVLASPQVVVSTHVGITSNARPQSVRKNGPEVREGMKGLGSSRGRIDLERV